MDDPALAGIIDADLWGPVREEIELIEEVRFEPQMLSGLKADDLGV